MRIGGQVRAQYHFRQSPNGLCAWDIHRLVQLSRDLVRESVPLAEIFELDEPYWSSVRTQGLTCREITEHARLMLDCDLSYPIILSSDGRVMDGMHRVCKVLLQGETEIGAVRFIHDPDALPYIDTTD
jgi:hypothetical protein